MSIGRMAAQKINDVLATKTPEQVEWFLKEFMKALKAQGSQHVSVKLLCNPRQSWAKCTPCDKAFAVEEIKAAGGCPDCGQDGDFEAHECFVAKPKD